MRVVSSLLIIGLSLWVVIGGLISPPPGRKFPGAEEEPVHILREVPPNARIDIEIRETKPTERPVSRSYFGILKDDIYNLGLFAKDEMNSLLSTVSHQYSNVKDATKSLFGMHRGPQDETLREGKESYPGMRERTKEAYEGGKESARGTYEKAKETGKEYYEGAKETGKEYYEGAKEKARDTYEGAKDTAKTYARKGEEIYEDVKEGVKEKARDTYETTKERAQETMGTVKEKGKEYLQDVKEAYEGAKERGQGVKEDTKEVLRTAKERAEDIYEGGKEYVKEGAEKTKEAVERTAEYGKEYVSDTYQATKEAIEKAKEKVSETYESGVEYAKKIVDAAKSTLEGSKERAKEKLEETYRTSRPTTYIELESYWRDFISSLPELSERAKMRLRDEGVKALQALENKRHTMSASEWEEAKRKLQEEVMHLESTFGRQITGVQRRFEDLWKRIEKAHTTGKIDFHLPHDAVMKCGNCGREYKFPEFLDMFDEVDKEMSFPDVVPADEKEVEEYYEGWTTWANYLKLKCKKCGASQWRDVVIFERRES